MPACHSTKTKIRFPELSVHELLRRGSNNIDLLRLGLALMVIYGHTWPIFRIPDGIYGRWDPLTWLDYPGVYAASVAVKLFFCFSGLLVTNSLLSHASVSRFVAGRFFRIWPALIAVLVFTAYFVGPRFSDPSSAAGFSGESATHYVVANAFLQTADFLPGVFPDNPIAGMPNASLWTLRYEVGAYLILLCAAVVGLLQIRWWVWVVFAVFFIDGVTGHGWTTRWLGGNPQVVEVPYCFALGCFVGAMKDRLTVGPKAILALAALCLVFFRTLAGPTLFYTLFFALALYLAASPLILRIRLPGDFSYGVYLWGFPIQQILADAAPGLGLIAAFGLASGCALFVGALSWFLLERPAIALGHRLTRLRIEGPDADVSTRQVLRA